MALRDPMVGLLELFSLGYSHCTMDLGVSWSAHAHSIPLETRDVETARQGFSRQVYGGKDEYLHRAFRILLLTAEPGRQTPGCALGETLSISFQK